MCTRIENSRYMQYLSAVTATMSMATAATYTFWPSPSLPKLQSETSPLGRPITDTEGSWVVSSFRLSIVPSALLAAWLVEKIGRKYSLLVAGVLQFIPWFLIIFGKTLMCLYIGRFVAGIGTGLSVIVCSIYNGEIAENDIRGKLGTTLVILKLTGSLMVLCLGPYISYTNLAIISAAIPVLFLCMFAFMPESPYYLTKVNKLKKAEESLKLLSSKVDYDKFVKNRLLEIENSVRKDMQNKTTVWEFFSNPNYRKAIFIMFGIKTLQQLSGEAAISAYMQPIIKLTESDVSPETSSIIFGFVQLPAALAASFLVDKLGRKPLLIISASGCAIALFAEGTFFFFQDVLNADLSTVAWIPTAGIALFLIMNPLGIASLPFVLVGELFPTNIKGIAVAASTFYGGGLSFIVAKFFKPLANVWGIYSMFWIFGSACTIGTIFVCIVVPETKGKSFREIQTMLNRKNDEIELS